MNRLRPIAARIFPSDRPIGHAARRIASRLGVAESREGVDIINHFAALYPDASFVQIGANDGVSWDPLREAIGNTNWSGLMVEPVPYVAARLRENIAGNPRLTIDMVAVAEEDGEKEFFHLPEADEGDEIWTWYHALGSFDRDHLLRHTEIIPDIESRIISTTVPCVTFDTLMARHNLDHVDVIQIDAEGYDHIILGLIDYERYAPKVVMYEHKQMTAADRRRIEAMLRSADFEFFSDWLDTTAISKVTLAEHPDLANRMRQAQRDNRRHESAPA